MDTPVAMETVEKEFITVFELAKKFCIGVQAARNMCQAKGFPARKVAGQWRISKEKLDKWIDTEFGGKVVAVYGGRRAY